MNADRVKPETWATLWLCLTIAAIAVGVAWGDFFWPAFCAWCAYAAGRAKSDAEAEKRSNDQVQP